MAAISVTYLSGGATVSAELYAPSAAGPWPIAVVAYGSEALKPPFDLVIRGFAEHLAAAGIGALIPDYLPVAATAAGAARFDAAAQILRDALTGVNWPAVTGAAGADPLRIGLVGFSLGGHLVLRAAAGSKAKAVVDFFGPVTQLAKQGTTLNSTSVVGLPPVQIHHGDVDDVVPIGESQILDTWLTSHLIRHEFLVYPGNGHPGPIKPDWSAAAQTQSTADCVRFLLRYL